MIFNDSLLIFEDEVRRRSRWQAFVELLRKHTFDLRPIHRYRGQLTLIGDVLGIDMRYVSTSAPLLLNVPLQDIVGLDIGYDNVFCFFMDRGGWGPESKPLGICYRDKDAVVRSFYLFASFDHGLGFYRHCRNQDLFAELSHRVMELKAKQS